ncbi:tRNA pseudouridine(38-40) synthase TruA [Embleya sp. NBC_00896]|uniref:tRNA pseudouridine(38-40) synthase TruA n=1 Tax=Embleya sp. NBC_00896 TaxID=2975961 RepID=UPI0038644CE6|nr:tRNA pseudouridine(38-40) synthase TruA [Embleya sp. NBC_00896]
MVRLRIDLSYDGTEFAGWARQRELRTVQGTLESALTTVLRLPEPAQLTVAGRTDAGVHARGQVAHLDVSEEVWAAVGDVALRRVAGALPRDVRVRDITVAPEGFDARFGAIWRRYAYRVCDAPGGVDPLRRGSVVWHDRPLDETRMNAAAERLVGEHDFASFCRKREGATTIRCLQEFSWARETPTGAEVGPAFRPVIVATVRADAFCHNMVRSLVGAMLAVGTGRKPVDWPLEVLGRAVRDSGVHVAPAHGLTLEEVAYPSDGLLAARVLATRRRRDGG